MGRKADDVDLVQRCIGGEPGAWRVFVDRFAGIVRAVARRYLRLHGQRPDDAELDDVLQEVFLAITRRDFRLLRNYDPTYSISTYLGVITRTEVHRVLRRRKPLTAGTDLEVPAAETPDEAARSEEREVVTRALEELPERDAELLRLRFLRDFDYKRIAATLRISEASVGQLLFRAKQRLLEKLRGLEP